MPCSKLVAVRGRAPGFVLRHRLLDDNDDWRYSPLLCQSKQFVVAHHGWSILMNARVFRAGRFHCWCRFGSNVGHDLGTQYRQFGMSAFHSCLEILFRPESPEVIRAACKIHRRHGSFEREDAEHGPASAAGGAPRKRCPVSSPRTPFGAYQAPIGGGTGPALWVAAK